jgi:hypothetical protein
MFQSSDHRYFYEIQTAHSRTLETQLSLCWLAKNLTGLSGGSHLYLKPYKFYLSRHSYTGVGLLTTSIRYHQRSGMRCLNFIEVSVIRRFAGCLSNGKLAFFKSWFYLGWKFEHIKYIHRHPSRVICTVSNEEIGQHFLYEKYHRHVLGKIYNVLFCALYICWGIGK